MIKTISAINARPRKSRAGFIYFILALASVVLFACGGEQIAEDEKTATIDVTVPVDRVTEVVQTVEVGEPVAAEATREVVKEVAKEDEPEVTVAATATAPPVPSPVVTATATVAPGEDREAERPRVDVPHRGYNAVGDPNAPITMFDFSDFT